MGEQSFLDRMLFHLRSTSKSCLADSLWSASLLLRDVSWDKIEQPAVIITDVETKVGFQCQRPRFSNMGLRYYTGYPKDLGPSRVVHFTSERQFVQLLHEGRPVVVAFTIKCPYAKHLDEVLEEAAAEFYPHIKFMRVECPKYPGFCITRQKKDYPFIEVFYNPEQAVNEGRVVDPNITKYAVKVLPYTYDQSAYGFREFFKRHKMMHAPDSK